MPVRTQKTKMTKTTRVENGSNSTARGLHISRRFSRPGVHPFDELEWMRRTSVITNPDGSVVFKMEDAEVPVSWSQLATDIVVSKYFRKAGVPKTGSETSVRQVVKRIARTICKAAVDRGGYFPL